MLFLVANSYTMITRGMVRAGNLFQIKIITHTKIQETFASTD